MRMLIIFYVNVNVLVIIIVVYDVLLVVEFV